MTDERPKPKYGELAPEGWVWQPPKEATPDPVPEAETSPAPAPVARPSGRPPVDPRWPAPDARAARSSTGAPEGDPAPGAEPVPAPRRGLAVDVNITIVLLVLGTLSVGSSVATLLDLNGYMTTAGAAFGLGGYPANEVTRVTGVTGAVLHVLLIAGTVWLSIRRIKRQKLAFWVPLTAAVVSFLITCICVAIAFSQAPELLDSLTTLPAVVTITPTP
ncbi:DUF6264 family protein [Herbiconiux flava]|uniref:NADH:ubiquinone oxidoreductase subunit 6 (Subunit J) n=1 Tax=Herbiconiux flava TaxID=881268 RepID=A0A852SSB5_9MICO|nr:DUF6264 family protein [Herbiconiux flava]NYD71868.1 NADH:ubiquinone oxidoreductase subunit 6 (subunit J) [Herbiconiux flava]GLK18169.1 hypothetical protein GCM10017602_26510 [Herbiconiux flava]